MKVIKKEGQFIIPVFICFLLFIIININGLFNISELSYWSGFIIKQPYRIISYSFVHKDFNHLFSNIFGIIVVRYCFLNLNLKNKFLFFYLTIFLVPMNTIFLLIIDNFLIYNYNHLLVGFSGVLFGSYTFILLSSIFGKKNIFNIFIGLEKSKDIKKLMILFLSLGIAYSLLPNISLSGHLSGILSGFVIFFL